MKATGVELPGVDEQLRSGPAGNKAGRRIFSSLEDLLAYHARTAPRRHAILASGCAPMTYGELWLRTNDLVRELQSLGISRSDRVAVVLPNGPQTALAIVAVAAGAVCVPLPPGLPPQERGGDFWRVGGGARFSPAGCGPAGPGGARHPR